MKYSIKVNEVRAKDGSNIKGFATVVFGDSFKITNIAILENKEKQSRKRWGRSCQKSGKIKPDKFRGVGVKSCVLFICLKQFMIWRMFQEITRMD